MSNIIAEIKVPQFGVNEITATIIEWKIENNSHVDSGDLIGELETTKSVFEIEATKSGYFKAFVEKNSEVEVNQLIALICYDLDALNKYKEKHHSSHYYLLPPPPFYFIC